MTDRITNISGNPIKLVDNGDGTFSIANILQLESVGGNTKILRGDGSGAALVKPIPAEWSVTHAPEDSIPAQIVIPGEEGKIHYITSILASYNKANSVGMLTLFVNGTQLLTTYVTNSHIELQFSHALKGITGENITLTLDNPNVSTKGTVFIAGFTRPALEGE